MKFEYSEVIDLTQPIFDKMDMPTGLRASIPPVEFKFCSYANEKTPKVSHISMPIHCGTHLDTPAHIRADGKCLDDYGMERFVGEGICVDVSQVKANEEITAEMLEPYANDIKEGDWVFLYTGWAEKMYGTLEYWFDSPVLSTGAGDWLVAHGAKMLGYDFFQDAGAKGFETTITNFHAHEHVLLKDCLHIEHLTNLSKVVGSRFFAIALPLKFQGGEGSMTRVVALR